jgi:hypothetical protein
VDEDAYIEAIDRLKENYDSRIFEILSAIGREAEARGWEWDGAVDAFPLDVYHWRITVKHDKKPDVDFDLSLEESLETDGTTDGVNFQLIVTDADGHLLDSLTPLNYTSSAWVDPTDDEAVSARLTMIEDSGVVNSLPALQRRQAPSRHRFHKLDTARRVTVPHGRCTKGTCVEHAYNKKIPSCKSERETDD